jgi:hypothetical protein
MTANIDLPWLLTGPCAKTRLQLYLFPHPFVSGPVDLFPPKLVLATGPLAASPAPLCKFVEGLRGHADDDDSDPRWIWLAFGIGTAPDAETAWVEHTTNNLLHLLSEVVPAGQQAPASFAPGATNTLQGLTPQQRHRLPAFRLGEGCQPPRWHFRAPLPENPFRRSQQQNQLRQPQPQPPPQQQQQQQTQAQAPPQQPDSQLAPALAPQWPNTPTRKDLQRLLDTCEGGRLGPTKKARLTRAWERGPFDEAAEALPAPLLHALAQGVAKGAARPNGSRARPSKAAAKAQA